MEEVSYHASDRSGDHVVVDQAYVNKHLGTLIENEDLSRFIL